VSESTEEPNTHGSEAEGACFFLSQNRHSDSGLPIISEHNGWYA